MKFFTLTLIAIGLMPCSSENIKSTPSEMEIIGSASMCSDRTITLVLRAEDGRSAVGDAAFSMTRGDEDYEKTIQHVGGLQPGQTKPYPAWPDNTAP